MQRCRRGRSRLATLVEDAHAATASAGAAAPLASKARLPGSPQTGRRHDDVSPVWQADWVRRKRGEARGSGSPCGINQRVATRQPVLVHASPASAAAASSGHALRRAGRQALPAAGQTSGVSITRSCLIVRRQTRCLICLISKRQTRLRLQRQLRQSAGPRPRCVSWRAPQQQRRLCPTLLAAPAPQPQSLSPRVCTPTPPAGVESRGVEQR